VQTIFKAHLSFFNHRKAVGEPPTCTVAATNKMMTLTRVALRTVARIAIDSTEILRYTTISDKPSGEDMGRLLLDIWAYQVIRMT
jgi:hypothetical protein